MSTESAECNTSQYGATPETVAQLSDRIWDYKPWWCQPWSIVLTGVVVVAASWLVLHRLWVTGLVALPILVWWALFLVLYPRAMAQPGMIADYQQGLRAEE
ncbi:MAG: DUF6737 family protein [Cyanobacteria bacterium J06597_1]